MKKREMIQKLTQFMDSIADENANIGASQADLILDFLTKEGMLPPYSQFIRQEDVLDRWSIGTGQKEYVRLLLTEWEQE